MAAIRPLLEAFFREIARDLPQHHRVEAMARQLLAAEPRLARLIRAALLDAYYRSGRQAAKGLIAAGASLPANASGSAPPLPPSVAVLPAPDGGRPLLFPGVDASAAWLHSRRLLTAADARRLDAEAGAAAFKVARVQTLDAVRTIRDAVADTVTQGGTLKEFRGKVREAVEDVFSPAQVETLYRTHVGLAQAAGQRAVLENEYVKSATPYRLWSATHDSRVRADHLRMEVWGPGGTAVYRADDPMWDTLWPPCHYNCRCVVIPLSIEDAARHGSKEAARWLRTGTPPAEPQWARTPYPVTPPPGWPTHTGIVAVA